MELFRGIKKEYGVLVVQSKPAGADVYINDNVVSAGKTPLTIGSKAGSVKIRVKKGKKEKTEVLKVIAAEKTASSILVLKGGSSLLLVLGGIALAGGGAAALLSAKKGNGNGGIPAPTTGSIQVNSTPTGAQVYLDGTDTGRTTNTTLTNISPGSHTVKLIKEGYEDYEESVSITAGQTTTVNALLTQHTITVTSPTSGTIWTKGGEVEITWETSGSASFKAHASPTTGLSPLSYPGRNLSPSFQRRAFRHNPAFRGLLRTRRGLESSNLSKNEGTILNKSSKFQDASKKFSSHAKENNIVHQRGKNRSFSSINLSLSPGTSFISSSHLPQALERSGDIKALTLTNVKIELYKGTNLVQTIASSTENDGSYSWTVDLSLLDGSDYKVRISCASDPGVYGESNDFTIEQKSITVTEPTSSTIWTKGFSANITWSYIGAINDVRIDLYKGTTLKETIVSSTENDGSYTLTEVDPYLEDGLDYRVRISCVGDLRIYGESDEFTIEEKAITVTEPTSSTIWSQGDSAEITWTSTGAINNVKIDLYKGITLNQTIVSSTENDGTYTWPEVDPFLADGADYKVKISWTSESGVYDESDEFMIEEKSITVTEPTNSTIWVTGDSADITWTSTGAISNVKIDLYKGITLKQTIWESTENDGSYTWTEVDPSLANGTDYKVRISDVSESGVYGESDEFEITHGYKFITKWGSEGSGDGQFWQPHGIAVDSSGYIYVADQEGQRIQKFTAAGTFVTKWGSEGSGDGQFISPTGIGVDSSGYVYVADTGNNRVQKFTSDGTFMTKWGTHGSGDGQFELPHGIAVDSSGYVYVADTENHRIQKFTSNGAFVTKWGSQGSGDGQFTHTAGVAVDSSGNVYVVDYGNNRIQKFTSNGAFVNKWGSLGGGDGQFNTPTAIGVDSSGCVYAVDSGNHRIQKFKSSGTFVNKWGSQGSGDGQFYHPNGIAVDSSGYVYVADSENHRIQKFGPISATQGLTGNNSKSLNNNFINNNLDINKNSMTKSYNMKSPLQNKLKNQKKQINREIRKNEERINKKDRNNEKKF